MIKKTTKVLYEVSDQHKAQPIYKDAKIEIGNRPLFESKDVVYPEIYDGELKFEDVRGVVHFIKFTSEIEQIKEDSDPRDKDKELKVIEEITNRSATIVWHDKQRFNDRSDEDIDREISYLQKLKKK